MRFPEHCSSRSAVRAPASSPVTSHGYSLQDRDSVLQPSLSRIAASSSAPIIAAPTTDEPSNLPKSPTYMQSSKQDPVQDEHNCRRNGSRTCHGAGEAAVTYKHGADIKSFMPKLQDSDYYTEPRTEELAANERTMPGYCHRVVDFVVGRRDYGHVKFLGETDVRRLELDSVIRFNKCEVLVYMDESKKPPVGQGLNKPAEVTLLNVKCVDKTTGQHLFDGPEFEKCKTRLQKKTEEQGAEFISYNALKGEWCFKVKHFSRFGLDNSDDDEDDTSRALVPVGMDLMEGIEGSAPVGRRVVFEPEGVGTPNSSSTEEDVNAYEEQEMQRRVPQVALPHSLPSQLRLDPVKMHQMRTLFFPLDEEIEDIMMPEGYGKLRDGNNDQELMPGLMSSLKSKESGSVSSMYVSTRAAWPRRSPWRGVPTKQMRISPHAFWQKVPQLTLSHICSLQDKHLETDIVPYGSTLPSGICRGITPASHSLNNFRLQRTGDERFLCDSSTDHLADAALFLGTSFRVGWGPHGLFVHSGNPTGHQILDKSFSSLIHVEKVSLDRTVRGENGTVAQDLVELQFVSPLRLHMSMSRTVEIVEENQDANLIGRSLVCSPMEVPSLCNRYEELIERQHMTKGLSIDDRLVLRHQVMAWQLLAVLFSEKDDACEIDEHHMDDHLKEHQTEIGTDPVTNNLTRRADFSSWLQDSVMHLVQEELRNSAGDDQPKQIFTFLTGRQLDHAVEKSIMRGDVRMACLLSQAGGSMLARKDLALQLDVWESESLDKSLIDDTRLSIFKLLSGDLLGALEGRTIDWKRFLGMLMWYQLAPDTRLPDIFNEYCNLLSRNDAPAPVPMYIEENSSGHTSAVSFNARDICFYLMLLHATQSWELIYSKKMFSSQSSTFDPLDHRLAWHQYSLLQAIGILGPARLNILDMSFVAQLLSVGLIDWAIYVVIHMLPTPEFPKLHEKTIKEILGQYCEVWSTSEKQQSFLEKDLNIPSAWLHESLAIYWNYVGDRMKALHHLLRSSQWQIAHVLFMTSVVSSLFIKCEHETIWGIVNEFEENKLDIENWELGAGLFMEFYDLKNSLKGGGDIGLSSLEQKIGACRSFFGKVKESQSFWEPNSTTLLRVSFAKMADEVSKCLSTLSNSVSPLLADGSNLHQEMRLCDAVMDAPLPEDMRFCRLHESVATFTSWLTNITPV